MPYFTNYDSQPCYCCGSSACSGCGPGLPVSSAAPRSQQRAFVVREEPTPPGLCECKSRRMIWLTNPPKCAECGKFIDSPKGKEADDGITT